MRRCGKPPDRQNCGVDYSNRKDPRRQKYCDNASVLMNDGSGDALEGKAYLEWLDARNYNFKEDIKKIRKEREAMVRKQQADAEYCKGRLLEEILMEV